MDASLALLFFIFIVKSGEAIKCFECNSRDDGACANDLLLEKFKVDCDTKPGDSKYTLCRKIEQIIELGMNDLEPHVRVIRKCGWANSTLDNTKCYFRAIHGGEQTVCGCSNMDYCNGGSTFSAMLVTLVSLILLPLFNQ